MNLGINHTAAAGCDLQYAVSDATRIQSALMQLLEAGGYSVDAESLIGDDTKANAGKEQLHAVLTKIASSATPDDIFILSYSGHGYAGVGQWGDTTQIWDTFTGHELQRLAGCARALNHDGNLLAWVMRDGTIKVWNVTKERDVKTVADDVFSVSPIAFSPDGSSLAAVTNGGAIKVWDRASGRVLRSFVGHKGNVNSVAFSPDGHTLVSGGSDFTVRLWDMANGEERRKLAGHVNTVASVAFSSDGKVIASGSKRTGRFRLARCLQSGRPDSGER